MNATFEPSGLRCLSIHKVVQHIKLFIAEVPDLPLEIRVNLAYLMSKRGLITDENIKRVGMLKFLYKALLS